jgi:hypothetical protein
MAARLQIDIIYEAERILFVAKQIIKQNCTLRVWRAHFGVSPSCALILWLLLKITAAECAVPYVILPRHLFWALYWMKVYNTEDVSCAFLHCDPKTFRLWVWRVLALLFYGLDTVHILFFFF